MRQKTTSPSLIILLLVLLSSCGGPSSLEIALKKAQENRAELEKVLQHYQGDEQKLQAARFLIENMDGHYTMESTACDTFRMEADTLFAGHPDKDTGFYWGGLDSILQKYWLAEQGTTQVPDLQQVKADYLIEHIDHAFRVWKESPWVKEYDFELFCHYVLPYRLATEPLSDWRSEFWKRYYDRMNGYSNKQQNLHHRFGIYNTVLGGTAATIYFPAGYMPELPLSLLPDVKVSDCDTYTAYCVALFRTFGLPAAADFIPQWGNRSMGHSWPVYLLSADKFIPFGVNEPIGNHFFHRYEEYLPKVFRRTYQKQPEMEALQHGDSPIPDLFRSATLQDVTDQYVATSDITVHLFHGIKAEWVYLAVFDNRQWTPVHYGKRVGRKARFTKMGHHIAYLPVCYGRGGRLIPAGHPFVLNADGAIHTLQADTVNTEPVRLLRKYKFSHPLRSYCTRLNGAKFQVANKEDFSDSLTIAWVGDSVECRFNRLPTAYEGKYRYFRFLSSPTPWNEIGEIELYENDTLRIRPKRLFGNNCNNLEALYDDDPLSYNGCNNERPIWAAVEFNRPVHLSHIRLLPRNDDNFIREGEQYQFFYWDGRGWTLLQELTGNREGVFHIDNVPTNALLLLRNITKGKEERIFTYQDGEQVWW